MTVHACRNYINCMRCASRLLDAHTHLVIITQLHQFQFYWFIRQVALARRQWNDHKVFESLPPMSTAPRLNLHTVPLMLNVKQGSCEYQFLKSFGIAWQLGSEPRSIDCKADALTAAPSLLNQALQNPQAAIHKQWCQFMLSIERNNLQLDSNFAHF